MAGAIGALTDRVIHILLFLPNLIYLDSRQHRFRIRKTKRIYGNPTPILEGMWPAAVPDRTELANERP